MHWTRCGRRSSCTAVAAPGAEQISFFAANWRCCSSICRCCFNSCASSSHGAHCLPALICCCRCCPSRCQVCAGVTVVPLRRSHASAAATRHLCCSCCCRCQLLMLLCTAPACCRCTGRTGQQVGVLPAAAAWQGLKCPGHGCSSHPTAAAQRAVNGGAHVQPKGAAAACQLPGHLYCVTHQHQLHSLAANQAWQQQQQQGQT